MSKQNNRKLCAGIIFALLTSIKLDNGSANDQYHGIKSGLTEPEFLGELESIVGTHWSEKRAPYEKNKDAWGNSTRSFKKNDYIRTSATD